MPTEPLPKPHFKDPVDQIQPGTLKSDTAKRQMEHTGHLQVRTQPMIWYADSRGYQENG